MRSFRQDLSFRSWSTNLPPDPLHPRLTPPSRHDKWLTSTGAQNSARKGIEALAEPLVPAQSDGVPEQCSAERDPSVAVVSVEPHRLIDRIE